jgi:hypothetical protein
MIQTSRFVILPTMLRRALTPDHRILVTLLTLLTVGCEGAGSTTPITRPTTPPSTILTYSGTLLPQSTSSYPITVVQPGFVEATLVGLGAPPTTTVGLGIGNLSASGTCSLIYSVNTAAGTAAQVVGTGVSGTLCVEIFDVGNLTGPTLYTITVASS